MAWIAGIDEVGYGPLLGPLIVSAALFEVPDPATDLWSALEPTVRRRPARDAVAVCDSKLLHRPDDLRPLERTAVAFWGSRAGAAERTFFEFVAAHCPDAVDQLAAPWYGAASLPLPFAHLPGALDSHVASLRAASARAGVRFVSLRSSLAEPGTFNEGVRRLGNKSEVLFEMSGRLYRWLWESHAGPEPLTVRVGKHGGRAFYAESLQRLFPEAFVATAVESRACSAYSIEGRGRRMRISFETDAEAGHFSVALASILAKYTREGLMACFNRWWGERCPGLRPTAGYWTDAVRFLRETEGLRRELGIPDGALVRER